MGIDLGRFGFHPAVVRWFAGAFAAPTEPQALAWPAIREGWHTLVAAPTGTGKTLAAFLAALDELVRLGLAAGDGRLPDETRVVYVSPLKALSNDVRRNLEVPLAGISGALAELGLPPVEIRTLVRTGDTTAAERARMVKQPPHVLVTTPESLYILLGSDGGRNLLATARTAIVDEIHAVAGSKRGSHLALSLERLAELTSRRGGELIRIGLSATQRPIDEVARLLVGGGGGGAPVRIGAGADPPACRIVDVGHRRDLDLGIEVPRSPLAAVMAGEVWEEVYDRLAELIAAHATTLVFVNTRRMAERLARHLSDRLGAEAVTSHHGSLSKEQRLAAEQRLKGGELRALVATASLELGIDVGAIDLVCQVGSTRSIATLLQRVGRSGHSLAGRPKGRIFPLSRDELVEAAALVDAVARGELDRLEIPEAPLDVLAQQVVAAVACEEWGEDDLFALVRRAHPYRDLRREEFDEVVAMLAQGFSTRRGRRGAYLHHDAVNGRLRARRGARLTALTSGGAIPDTADYDVVLEPADTKIGTVNEDFAVESLPGDVFQLGNASWRILKIEQGRVRVEDAQGSPPSIPFWLGEAPGRTNELSAAVARLRAEVEARLGGADSLAPAAADGANGHQTQAPRDRLAAARAWLEDDLGLAAEAAAQIVDYLGAAHAALGVLPTAETLVLERFFDGVGDMHLVLHAPFGSRVNRAWGLALRKRFCRKFNFELQAAATEDAILLSLGPSHSFPLADVYRFLHSTSVRDLLIQALLDAPMFGVRWRWNASRALALPRFRGGRKVPPPFQRQAAEDLVAVVFPDQLACLETIQGDREVPDHPLVRETLRDCLEEAMDVATLERLLAAVEAGGIRLVARDLTEPSPLAHEILNARPYSFLDDAPLEERRAQAVLTRRWLDPETASDLGALDPAAIERVRAEARPEAESADELHDALVVHGYLPAGEAEAAGLRPLFDELAAGRRAGEVAVAAGGPRLWVAAERLAELRAVHPGAPVTPEIAPPARLAARAWSAEEALVELVRGRLEALGPTTAAALAGEAGLPRAAVAAALAALEGEGFALQGRFTSSVPGGGDGGGDGAGREVGEVGEVEWCERRLLARIHRYTLNRLRREIEPVSTAVFTRFLLAWQRVDPEARGEGMEGLAAVLDQLAGFEAAAAAWEGDLLPARVADYDPAWLDGLCLSGRYVWCRLSPAQRPQESAAEGPGRSPAASGGGVDGAKVGNGGGGGRRARPGPVRTTPIALVRREWLPLLRELAGRVEPEPLALSAAGRAVFEHLRDRGASFFADLAHATGLLKTQVEAALGELVAHGLATADSFTGLRALLVPAARRPPIDRARRRPRAAAPSLENAGRWSLLAPAAPAATPGAPSPGPNGSPRPSPAANGAAGSSPEAVEHIARALLARYGIVFRRLLDREGVAPPWRDLLRVLRRLEARGEIRGGRFVTGFSGEQYALPEAVAKLRAARRADLTGDRAAADPAHTLVSISAADPLNLVGVVTPGARLPALARNRVLFRDGLPVALRESGEVRFLPAADPVHTLPPAERWQAEQTLLSRPVPPRLRPYLGRSA